MNVGGRLRAGAGGGGFAGDAEGAGDSAVGGLAGDAEGVDHVADIGGGGADQFIIQQHDAVEEFFDVVFLFQAIGAGALAAALDEDLKLAAGAGGGLLGEFSLEAKDQARDQIIGFGI